MIDTDHYTFIKTHREWSPTLVQMVKDLPAMQDTQSKFLGFLFNISVNLVTLKSKD